MPLFSVIGLLIAVFGATYTAISAFRAHYNPIVSDHIKTAPEKVALIRSSRGDSDGDANQKYFDQMKRAYRWWHWCSITPIALFLLFAFGLSGWLFFHWDLISGNFDSSSCKLVAEINTACNGVALIGACISYFQLRNLNNILTQNFILAGKNAAGPANGAK
jgi:hypothetical protein